MAWIVGFSMLVECRSPTELTVTLPTDVPCGQIASVTITAADPSSLETGAPRVTTDGSTCNADGVGSLVLVPSGAKDARIAVKVIATLGAGGGTIVARRRLRFLPHTPLLLPIELSSKCVGKACDANTTCVQGECVDADVPDPSACAAPGGCPESLLGGSDGGAEAGPEAGAEAGADAASDAPVDPAAYHEMTNAAFWSAFDLSSVTTPTSYAGAVFDGRYVYLVPNRNGAVARYDTTAPFGAAASWSTFDTAALAPNATFFGAAFDGSYAYFVPSSLGILVRFDTQRPFGALASWATFDLSSLAPVHRFAGGVFDGRYVYLVPSSYLTGTSTVRRTPAVRYDTQAPFGAAPSWEAFAPPGAVNLCGSAGGGTFDGRYVYFAPDGACPGIYAATFTRYDTQGSFSAASSWSAFGAGPGFIGAVYDGRYVHFAPAYAGGAQANAQALDTRGPFDVTSLSSFEITSLDANAIGRFGAAFDGRYVYLVPDNNLGAGTHDGVVVRYDSRAPYTDRTSWSTFDATTLGDGGTLSFGGAAFDGEYLYLVPIVPSSIVVRFDAKSPPSLPPGYTGSFL
jgi:hypothetical protein